MWKSLGKKTLESLISVLPIAVLVIIFGLAMPGIDNGVVALFSAGVVFVIIGMAFFTLGADTAMMPMGSHIGSYLSKTKKSKLPFVLLIGFFIGFVITLAEPDLMVLANQLAEKAGDINYLLLISVAVGVGIFLAVSLIRTFFNIKLRYILLTCYALVFILAVAVQFTAPDFLAIAFDSGGVTTGPITVPFIMALGIGLAAVRGGKSNEDDSFGMIALCSVGPIIAVMILGLADPSKLQVSEAHVIDTSSFGGIMSAFGSGILEEMLQVAVALVPIIAVFLLFQVTVLKLPASRLIQMIVGLVYTFAGLSIFLTGVNVGFTLMGRTLGAELASQDWSWVIIPLGMLMGCFIVMAEPAVHVLTKQVEEVTGGAISRRAMMVCMCAGVAVCIGFAMIRVLTQISVWWFLAPVYALSLLLMFFVPQVFTGIAFDSGGVASGPMTATFLLPFAIGAAGAVAESTGVAVNESIFQFAYGLVAYVAMAPLLTIQLMGLAFKIKTKRQSQKVAEFVQTVGDDDTVEFLIDDTVGDTVVYDDDGNTVGDTGEDNDE